MPKAIATRTVNPLHFEDLEPHRFEDLVRQLAHGFRNWSRLEAIGALGADEGRDILGIESITARSQSDESKEVEEDETEVDERLWLFQCKRYKTLGPRDVVKILREAVPDGSEPPYGFVLAAPCKLSATAMADFHIERARLGIKEGHLWVNNHLEDMLFRPENDHLLFAYFGISLVIKRASRLRSVRSRISMKKKLFALAEDPNTSIDDRLYTECLIRDIEDETYFDEKVYAEQYRSETPLPWHQARLDRLTPRGILVEISWASGIVKPDGTWDILRATKKQPGSVTHVHHMFDHPHLPPHLFDLLQGIPETERKTVSQYGLIPFDNIVEVDKLGDPAYDIPHIFCTSSPSPYSHFYIMTRNGMDERTLDPKLRRPLFQELAKSLKIKGDVTILPAAPILRKRPG